LIGGLIAGFAFSSLVSAMVMGDAPQLYIVSTPNNISVGKVTDVKFLAFGNGGAVSKANITLGGAASGNGTTDQDGYLILPVNATSRGKINLTASKNGFKNSTTYITATPELDITAIPSSITTGTATFVTFSVTGAGKPVSGALVNISGAGIELEGATDSAGQIIKQINAPSTGKIMIKATKDEYVSSSASISSSSQPVLSISPSQSTVTVNTPVYVVFTVTAGGSPVRDATVTTSGTASGSAITNNDGNAIIQFTPVAEGTITVSASATGYAGGSSTITSSRAPALSLAANPTSIIAGMPSYVVFTVTSGSNFINEALVTITGAASGNGVTNQNGQAIVLVNSTAGGTITATVSKQGFTSASTSLSATGAPALSVSANPPNVTDGVPTYVTFTVKSGSNAVSGATVSVSGGGITTDGMTNSAGQVTLQLNGASAGTINVVAKKAGYSDATTTLAH
jgi:hypothetical protein